MTAKEKKRQQFKKWADKNREHLLAWRRAWWAKHKERVNRQLRERHADPARGEQKREYERRYYSRNAATIKARANRYRSSNREAVNRRAMARYHADPVPFKRKMKSGGQPTPRRRRQMTDVITPKIGSNA